MNHIENTKLNNVALGKKGEDVACDFLLQHGYKILERNWRCRFGEADIIAVDSSALVFVEVKTRTSLNSGFPSEAVGKKKRDRYEKIALAYLSNHEMCDSMVRFDVISIVQVSDKKALLKHHINAFGVGENGC